MVEYSGGSTGASIALVCAAKGYRLKIVTSDAFSQEKRDHMAALGAELVVLPSEGGRTTKKLIQDMIEAARELSREPHTFWSDQLDNPDSIAGYHALGEEIWEQTEGQVDAFVHSVGAAASSRGVATVLKRHKPGTRIVVVEPAESAVLQGGPPGAARHRRDRDRAHPAAVGAEPRGRGRAGVHGGSGGAWRGGWHARKVCLPAPPREGTSSPRCAWRSGWAEEPGGDADDRFRPEVPEHRRVPEPLAMLYMVLEDFKGDAGAVYRRFRERGRLAPEGLRYVDSWVSEDLQRCYQVMECDDPALLREWMERWQDLVDFEVVPVLRSAEAAARIP